MKDSDQNQAANDTTGMNSEGGGKQKEGDYVVMVREIIKALKSSEFSTHEKSIITRLTEVTIGFHCGLRNLTQDEIMKDLNLSRPTSFRALSRLLKIKLLKRNHIGNRRYEYGLNTEYFGRIYPWGDISNVRYLDRYKKDNDEESQTNITKSQTRDYEVSPEILSSLNSETLKVRRAATRADKVQIKHSSNIDLKISLREIRTFVNSRSRNTKTRWINLINNIITHHPEDQHLLWLAIETAERTKTDFLGRPIYSSTLNLFEASSWPGMKAAFLEKLKSEKQAEEKERKRKETEDLIAAKRASLEKEASDVRIDNISPIFSGFVARNTK
jgi:hypothetical protein